MLQFEEFEFEQPNGRTMAAAMPDCQYPFPEDGRFIVFLRPHTQMTDAYFRVTTLNRIDIASGTATLVGQGPQKMADVQGMASEALIARIEAVANAK